MCVRNLILGYYKLPLPDPTPVSQSHHSLTDLTTYDDHPQYWLVAGRPSDILRVLNSTDSISIYTGALVVSGGVGIGSTLNVGGTINGNNINGTNITGNIITANTGLTTSYIVSSDGSAVHIGTDLNMTGNQAINATRITCSSTPVNPTDVVRLSDLSSSLTTISHHSLLNLSIYDDHPQYWSIPGRSTDILTVPNTTTSTTPTTGALVVGGGVGIGGSITCSGMLNIGGLILGTDVSLSGTLSTSVGIATSGNISASGSISAYGLISAPNISSTGTISSAHMSCSSAPSNASDVVRLQDVVIPQYGSFNGQWQDTSAGSGPEPVSIKYEVFGPRFTLYQIQNIQNVEAYYSLSYLLPSSTTPLTVIPSQYIPSSQQIFPLLGAPTTSTTGNVVMALIITTTGQLQLQKLDGSLFASPGGTINYARINPWSVSWYLN